MLCTTSTRHRRIRNVVKSRHAARKAHGTLHMGSNITALSRRYEIGLESTEILLGREIKYCACDATQHTVDYLGRDVSSSLFKILSKCPG